MVMRFDMFKINSSKTINEGIDSKAKKLDSKLKKEVNKDLENLLTQQFTFVPLDGIFDILEIYELIPIQDDNTGWVGILTGNNGKMELKLGDALASQQVENTTMYAPIKNTSLVITWSKSEDSKKYQVSAYVS